MHVFKSALLTLTVAAAPLLAAPATMSTDIVISGGAGSPVTLSLGESFSFTLNADFTGWSVYLVARDVFASAVTPPSYGYLTAGSGLKLETSTGVTSYSPGYTAGNSYFGTTAIALEFGFDSQKTFAAGTVFTLNAGTVSTLASPVAAAPNHSGAYDFAITDGNGNYFVPAAATAAVPEPATYASVVGAATLAGAALRRRRRANAA